MITHSRSKQLFFDSDGEALAPMVEKLQLWRELDPDDQRAVLSLPYKLMTLDAGRHIVRQGDKATQSCLLLSGFAVRHKVAGNDRGRRGAADRGHPHEGRHC